MFCFEGLIGFGRLNKIFSFPYMSSQYNKKKTGKFLVNGKGGLEKYGLKAQ